MHNGSCLCGAVKYQIDAPIESATHCHCGQCRKGHGAAFASYGNVRREHFRFTAGQDQVAAFHSSPRDPDLLPPVRQQPAMVRRPPAPQVGLGGPGHPGLAPG